MAVFRLSTTLIFTIVLRQLEQLSVAERRGDANLSRRMNP